MPKPTMANGIYYLTFLKIIQIYLKKNIYLLEDYETILNSLHLLR